MSNLTKHSENFQKVKDYYILHLWTKVKVNKAVADRWITAEEYEEIVGEPYIPINE